MEATAYAQIPNQTTVIDADVNNEEQAQLEVQRVLFFAMDALTDQEKREAPFKAFGGMYLPNIPTLQDTQHMLYRCQLTQLPPFKMIPEWDMMLPPEARNEGSKWRRSFTQTVVVNGEAKPQVINGFLESDASYIRENGTFKNKRSNHLVFAKRYNAHDARQATARPTGNQVGGVVEITALLGATPLEVREAQYFFFPKWDEIRTGASMLPTTTKELEAHLNARIAEINAQEWSEAKKAKFFAIGRDMVRSVTEFTYTAVSAIRGDAIAAKEAFNKGETTARPSAASDKYIAQTGEKRKDDLLTGENSALNDLTAEMRAERAEKAERDAKMLLLEERKQYTAEIQAGLRERDEEEEIRLGIRKKVESVPPPVEATANPYIVRSAEGEKTVEVTHDIDGHPVIDGVPMNELPELPDIRVCGAPTASGTCKRTLNDGEKGCFQHNGN